MSEAFFDEDGTIAPIHGERQGGSGILVSRDWDYAPLIWSATGLTWGWRVGVEPPGMVGGVGAGPGGMGTDRIWAVPARDHSAVGTDDPTGPRLTYRLLGDNHWLKDFFATWQRLQKLELIE